MQKSKCNWLITILDGLKRFKLNIVMLSVGIFKRESHLRVFFLSIRFSILFYEGISLQSNNRSFYVNSFNFICT